MLEMLKNGVGSTVVRSSAGTAGEPALRLSNFRTPGLTQAGKVETLTPSVLARLSHSMWELLSRFCFLGPLVQTLFSVLPPLWCCQSGDSKMSAS